MSPSLNRAVLGRFDGFPDGAAGQQANAWLAVDAGGTTVKSAQVRMSELVRQPPRSAPMGRDAGDVLGVLIDVVSCGLERSDFRPRRAIPVAVGHALDPVG